jgi:hypothetical protein
MDLLCGLRGSRDLALAGFHLWGLLNSFFYDQRPNNRDEQNAKEASGMTICYMPDVFQRTRNYWRNRVQLYIYCNCGPFQHLLQTVNKLPDAVLYTANKFYT